MHLFKVGKPLFATTFCLSLLLLTACSSSGGGGGNTPTVPADAATISVDNATGLANTAVAMMAVIETTLDPSAPVSAPSAVFSGKLHLNNQDTSSVTTGLTETDACIDGGTVSDDYQISGNTANGTMSLSNCNIGNYLIANGNIAYSVNWNDNTGDFHVSGNASINYSGAASFSLVMKFDISSNEVTGGYSSDIDYSVSGYPGGGFLANTTENFIGNDNDGSVSSGQMIVEGAGNTRLRISVTSANNVSVEIDNGNGVFSGHTSLTLSDLGANIVINGGQLIPSLPVDAAVITAANASDIASSVVSTLDATSTIVGIEQASLPSMQELIQLVTQQVFAHKPAQSIVSGITQVTACSGGGTITNYFSDSGNAESGTVVFTDCITAGMTINGSFNYQSIWNANTGAYSDSGNGIISYAFTGNSFELVLNFSKTGNDISGEYSTNLSYSVSGIPGGGFIVTTTSNLQGVGADITAGQLFVLGAQNTRLRITLTNTNLATVELDNGSGSFVVIDTGLAL